MKTKEGLSLKDPEVVLASLEAEELIAHFFSPLKNSGQADVRDYFSEKKDSLSHSWLFSNYQSPLKIRGSAIRLKASLLLPAGLASDRRTGIPFTPLTLLVETNSQNNCETVHPCSAFSHKISGWVKASSYTLDTATLEETMRVSDGCRRENFSEDGATTRSHLVKDVHLTSIIKPEDMLIFTGNALARMAHFIEDIP